jgi:hypothetical protein
MDVVWFARQVNKALSSVVDVVYAKFVPEVFRLCPVVDEFSPVGSQHERAREATITQIRKTGLPPVGKVDENAFAVVVVDDRATAVSGEIPSKEIVRVIELGLPFT